MEAENMKISQHTNSVSDIYDWPENSRSQLKHVTLMNKGTKKPVYSLLDTVYGVHAVNSIKNLFFPPLIIL
jgi:hypothetical protein